MFTDGPYGGASPNLMLTDMSSRKVLRPLLERGVMPVVPGFIGAAPIEDGDGGREPRRGAAARGVATLGRGGTDLTATLLGRALGAREVLLWKDVPGMLTADPRVVPDARVIPQLHVREAAELAYFGAKVLAPARADPGRRGATSRYSCAPSPIPPRSAPRSRGGAPWTATRSRRCRRSPVRRW